MSHSTDYLLKLDRVPFLGSSMPQATVFTLEAADATALASEVLASLAMASASSLEGLSVQSSPQQGYASFSAVATPVGIFQGVGGGFLQLEALPAGDISLDTQSTQGIFEEAHDSISCAPVEQQDELFFAPELFIEELPEDEGALEECFQEGPSYESADMVFSTQSTNHDDSESEDDGKEREVLEVLPVD